MANRQERIKTVIGKDIREILQFELKNENIGFLTVTNIDVSNDYSYVRIYVSFILDDDKNFAKLEKQRGYVKSLLAKKLNLRRTPEIQFILDKGYEYEDRISNILNKENEELNKIKK